MTKANGSKMEGSIVLYTEYNGWELETWHHIYYCSRDVRRQVDWLASICMLLNKELDVRDREVLWHTPVSTYRSRYKVSVLNQQEANLFQFPITGYKYSKRSSYDVASLPFHNEIKEIIQSNNELEPAKIISNNFDEIFKKVYKKFTD